VRGRASLADLRAALLAWLAGKRARFGPDKDGPAAADDGTNRHHRTVRRAWQQFLGYLSLRRTQTKTPGEIARHAVRRDGLPGEPVRALRDTYREVEYGSRSAEARLERVDAAVTAIEDEIGADEDEDDEETPRAGGTA
jgi:hypothetical protein